MITRVRTEPPLTSESTQSLPFRADPRVTGAWVQKYFWSPHMGVVILLTPPHYKCFYGYDSNTEMLP